MDILQFKKDITFEYKSDEDLLKNLKRFYTYQGYTPSIEIKGDMVHIHIDESVFRSTQKDFQKAADFCNQGKFDLAEPILKRVVEVCPLHADAHRILAQIEMERGNYEKAYDKNLDALAVDPSNLWALILMGNICARKGDLETSSLFYEKVLEYHPDDSIALNNVAANYMRQKQYEKAAELFAKVLEREETYLNAYYGLALSYYELHDYGKAFDTCVEGMKKGVNRPQNRSVRDEIQKLAMEVARTLVGKTDYSIEIGNEKLKLSMMTKVPMKIETDASLATHARLEYGVARRRDYNRVVYNPTKQYHEHLLMHEFMHLEMNLAASADGRNKIMMSGQEEEKAFRRWIAPELGKLRGKLTKEHLEEFCSQMFHGLMLQASNCPLDLLVEDSIYESFPAMRPLQMLSLVQMEIENVESVNKAARTEIPTKVVSANRIMNVVSALHLQQLYGFNIAPHYKATPREKAIAQDLYDEYLAYKSEFKAGEEYDLLEYFAQTLGLDGFYEAVSEMHFKTLDVPTPQDLPVQSIDPESHDEQNAAFAEMHRPGSNPAETMMMSMYMLGAMQYLNGLPKDDVYKIALEIAMKGLNGIRPDGQGYSVDAIPGKVFGGFEFLAYYYVSWAIAIPEKLDGLGLPFKDAYEAARQMYEKQNGKG